MLNSHIIESYIINNKADLFYLSYQIVKRITHKLNSYKCNNKIIIINVNELFK